MKLPSSPGALQRVLRTALAVSLGTGMASAATHTHRYFQFKPTKLRSSTTLIQLSEFQFFNGSTAIPTAGVTVTDQTSNSPAGEPVTFAFDGILTNKWLNYLYTGSALIFDFGSAVTIDSYNYVTGNDAPSRDPVSWQILVSDNGVDWTVVDTRNDQLPNGGRNVVAYTSNMVLPAAPPPNILFFEFYDTTTPFIVKNGTPIDFFVDTENTSTAVISNNVNSTTVNVTDPNNDATATVTPPANSDTTFTLTATGPGGTATKSVFVRSVAGGNLSYRYVRYTPVKLRGSGQTIQLSNFQFSDSTGVKVPVSSVSSPAGTVQPGEEIQYLIDEENGTPTKWLSGNLAPIIFDFGAAATFSSYNFSTGNDAPDRDPIQWYIEGSNDNTTWDLIENMTSITYPVTQTRNTASGEIPFPGSSVKPVALLSASVSTLVAGESSILTYTTVGADTVSITPSVTTSGTSGTATVTPSAATTYTLTATKTGGNSATATAAINVAVPSGVINFANFDSTDQIAMTGTATILNDYATFYNAPNAKRLRLTSMGGGQKGTAWSISKLKLSDGFETTYDASIANSTYINGADGVAFIIQNTDAKYTAVPPNELQFTEKSVSIVLDSYPDRANENGSQANLEVFVGNTLFAIYNLNNVTTAGGLSLARGYNGVYLVTGTGTTPYKVRVVYTPGSLSIYLDGTLVANNLAIDLAAVGALDSEGKGWTGFSARTGGLNEYHDIVNWTLTPTVAATTPLAITSSAFTFGTTSQLALTFTSTSGKTYVVKESTDLVNWNQIGSSVTASSTSTSTTVPFTKVAKSFFRVEQTN